MRTPMWLPFVGLSLLAAGAVASYLWIYPGVRATSATDDAGASDAATEAATPAQAAPGAAQPTPAPGGGGH